MLNHSDIASSNLRYQATLLGEIHIGNKSNNIRCDNARQNMSVCTKVPTDCAYLRIWSVWCLFVNLFAHVINCNKASFLRSQICVLLTFCHCICWVSRSSHKNVRHYCRHYFCHMLRPYRPFSVDFTLCVPLHNSPLGELGPWRTVCPLVPDTSAKILEFSSPGEHWPLPGGRTETRQSSLHFIYPTNMMRFKEKYSHSLCLHTEDGWTD